MGLEAVGWPTHSGPSSEHIDYVTSYQVYPPALAALTQPLFFPLKLSELRTESKRQIEPGLGTPQKAR